MPFPEKKTKNFSFSLNVGTFIARCPIMVLRMVP